MKLIHVTQLEYANGSIKSHQQIKIAPRISPTKGVSLAYNGEATLGPNSTFFIPIAVLVLANQIIATHGHSSEARRRYRKL